MKPSGTRLSSPKIPAGGIGIGKDLIFRVGLTHPLPGHHLVIKQIIKFFGETNISDAVVAHANDDL